MTITKTFKYGTITGIIEIEEGIAILRTNNFRVTKSMFDKSVADGKPNLFYDYKHNAMIEKYPGKTAIEIAALIETDLFSANLEAKKSVKFLEEKK